MFINARLEKIQEQSAESSGAEVGILEVLGKHPCNEILLEVCCLKGKIFQQETWHWIC